MIICLGRNECLIGNIYSGSAIYWNTEKNIAVRELFVVSGSFPKKYAADFYKVAFGSGFC